MNERVSTDRVAGRSDSAVKAHDDHYQIPREPGKKSALLLAGLMHVLLILFLWIGIHWQSKEPVGVEAEIWDMNTRFAAPLPAVVAPPHSPSPPPQVRKVPAPPVTKQAAQEQDAEIAIERAREQKKIEAKRLEEKQRKKEQEEEQQRQQQRADELKKQEQKKQELAKTAAQNAQKKADALIQQQRSDNLKRLTGQLTSQIPGSGDAVRSTGNNRVDPGYAGKIAAKIKSNMIYVGSETGAENPTVNFRIDLFPDGSLRSPPRKIKSSGVSAFDDAVERAITKAAPYPADNSGNVPATIPLTYRLKD